MRRLSASPAHPASRFLSNSTRTPDLSLRWPMASQKVWGSECRSSGPDPSSTRRRSAIRGIGLFRRLIPSIWALLTGPSPRAREYLHVPPCVQLALARASGECTIASSRNSIACAFPGGWWAPKGRGAAESLMHPNVDTRGQRAMVQIVQAKNSRATAGPVDTFFPWRLWRDAPSYIA